MADIIVTGAQGLPEKSYVSIRVGDVRRQMQYKPGSKFRFDGDTVPRHFILDVFEKIGTAQVSVADLARGNPGVDVEGNVEVLRTNGASMNVSMKVMASGGGATTTTVGPSAVVAKQPAALISMESLAKQPSDDMKETKKAIRHQAAVKAKNYLDGNGVQKILQGMVHTLLEKLPEDPLDFMSCYLQERRTQPLRPRPPAEEAPLPDWSSQPGLGENELPGFAVDGSDSLPDISKHNSLMAGVLRKDPQLYERLSKLRSSHGSTLAKCIKTGVDNRGHQMIRAVGIAAADEFCYDVFRDLFGPVVSGWHGEWEEEDIHPLDIDPLKVTNSVIDPGGGHVLSVQVRAVRNISGVRMPPACSKEERREVERVVARALMSLPDELQGTYLPLRGSCSYVPRPGGMTEKEQKSLLEEELLFDAPDSTIQLSSGLGRHWPDARGVFRCQAASSPEFSVWVNDTDHLKILSRRPDADLKQAFKTFARAESSIKASMKKNGLDFARTSHFGFLSPDPAQIGTGMTLSARLQVPLLSSYNSEFKQFCRRYGLHVQVVVGDREGGRGKGVWEVFGSERLGSSEVDQVNLLIEGCRFLVDLETQLEAGGEINFAELLAEEDDEPPWSEWPGYEEVEGDETGLGDSEYPGFPADICPAKMPNFQKHHSAMAEVFKDDPSIYDRLKSLRTSYGVSLAKCIKTGVDNKGHPMIKTVGMVAGDDECYDVFRELFDEVIQKKHPDQDIHQVRHVSDLDYSKVSSEPLDPLGERVLAVRIRMSRNLKGLRMPPACSFDERRQVENTIVGALDELDSDLEGEYFPLTGSNSYAAKPGGMSLEEGDSLRKENFSFSEPDSEVQLSSGFGRHWPDARGVWVAKNRRVIVRVNEDDHLRMVSVEKSSNLKQVFTRICKVHKAIEDAAQLAGRSFAHSDRLGYLAVCPSNIGTCLIASVTVRIPLLSAQPEFKNICKKLGIMARTGAAAGRAKSEGVLDISNAERLGSSEVEQVNAVLEGCRLLLDFEARLADGEVIEFERELGDRTEFVDAHPGPAGGLHLEVRPGSCAAHGASGTQASSDVAIVDFSDIPGLGSAEYPGFSPDACPDVMPDLSRNFSLMADVLKHDPSIYERLKQVTTRQGVTLARCIKTGVDNAGHPMIKTVGACAGDAESYEAFREMFDPVIQATHRGSKFTEAGHQTDLDLAKVRDVSIDPAGGHMVAARLRAQRNFAEIRMPPAASLDERQRVERMALKALEELTGECAGTYFPLQGSTTYTKKPTGMSQKDQERLQQAGLLFNEPDAALVLATGSGRDWPEARGVFLADSGKFAAWINEEDHLRLMVFEESPDLKVAFSRLCTIERSLKDSLRKDGLSFAWNSRLGYLSSCPSNLGSGLRVEVTCRLPLLSQHPGYKALCRRLRLQVRPLTGSGNAPGVWDVVNVDRLGPSDVEQVNIVFDGCRQLIDLETRLERGEEVDLTAVQVV